MEPSAPPRAPGGRRNGRATSGRNGQELRAYAGPEPSVLRVAGRTGDLTDLAGDPTGERFDGELALRPHQIVTVALDEPTGS